MVPSVTFPVSVNGRAIAHKPAYVEPMLPMHDRPTVSVVVPAMNEAENLPHVLPRIPVWVDEVLLVDGNSKDNTVEVARHLRPDIRIVMQQGKGKGSALREGFEAATGEIIVMIDADGSTDPSEIPAYVGALLAGADFAKGSRFLQGGGTADISMLRSTGNWGLTMLVRQLFGGNYSDLCYGYNAFWKRVLPMLSLDGNGFEIETMMNVRALKAGLKITEIPSFEAERIHGSSNLRTFPDGWRVLKTIFREWRAPYRGAPASVSYAEAAQVTSQEWLQTKQTAHTSVSYAEPLPIEAPAAPAPFVVPASATLLEQPERLNERAIGDA